MGIKIQKPMNQELTARTKATGGTEQRVWSRAADAEEGV